ncbi:MAG: hypothetical protein WDA42_07445, partial [Candidatus Bathyarchaeia archaeon]
MLKRTTLTKVPYMTSRGTFILDGTEYIISSQQRLLPGIFTRQRDTGEIESHVNVAKGFGHHYSLDPDKGKFKIRIGQANVPLLPVMKALGATDKQIRDAWGADIYAANVEKNPEKALRAMYTKLYRERPVSNETMMAGIQKAFNDMVLDPEVTKATLGKGYDRVNPDTILAATRKIIDVYKGNAAPDDRDALNFQKIVGPEDIFAERFKKSANIIRQILWKNTPRNSLDRVPVGAFDDLIRGVIFDSGLGNPLAEINNIELLDHQHRITRMGQGGIESLNAIPYESRMVQPTQMGYLDPVTTPESLRVGVESRLSINTRLGADGKIYSRFININNGRPEWLAPRQAANAVVAFPGSMASNEPYVIALKGGKEQYVPRESVNYELAAMDDAFGPMASLIPFKSNSFPQRIAMGSRFLSQALPLTNAEAPLVQNGISGEEGRSYSDLYSDWMGAAKSPVSGTVTNITPDEVTIKDTRGQEHIVEMYNNLPYARATFIHNTPVVSIGQQIEKGGLVAKSNYTDDKGTVALGLNARIAYLPVDENYEDAYVVSESFAKRATSEHAYTQDLTLGDDITADKNAYMSIFAAKLDKETLDKFNPDGSIKPGMEVKKGDPIILAVKEKKSDRPGFRKVSWSDASVTWEHENPGVVTDVHKSPKSINVMVKATAPMQTADKLSNLFGGKGIVVVRPDSEMPTDEDGNPIDVLASPMGIISRGNVSQVWTTLLGKIAKKRGEPYKLPDFSNQDMQQFVKRELQRHGVSATETLIDPKTGKSIPGVLTGYDYLLKLYHTAESKLQDRGETGGYTAEGLPGKGATGGSAKRLGLLDIHALLSAGAYQTIRDGGMIRGQKNEDYWRQFMAGYTPPEPTVPFIWEKFVTQLQAAGINPIKKANRLQVLALSKDDVDELAGTREITNAETIDWRRGSLKTIPGGLFDEAKTGGLTGNRWASIKMHEPMPNPVMAEPIQRILGLTAQQFEDILIGKEPLNNQTGPKAIQSALININLDKEIQTARAQMAGSRKTSRDTAIKKLHYLEAAKANNLHPKDWIWTKFPVLPPKFRPISMMESGTILSADVNTLYKTLIEANDNLKKLSGQLDDLSEERKAVWDTMKSVVGLTDPVQPLLKQQRIKGLLKTIIGDSPKAGVMQRKLLGISADVVGRAVVRPNAQLDMDQVGIPIEA